MKLADRTFKNNPCEVTHRKAGGASYPQELTLLIHSVATVWLGVDLGTSCPIFSC